MTGSDWGWAVSAAGAILAFIVLLDVFLTVLHIDTDGPAARGVLRAVWSPAAALGRRFPQRRRFLMAVAGPCMIVGLFALWVTAFILAFALIYWPFLDQFRTADPSVPLGFMDALYFSGVTATVLGYGDLSPLGGGLRSISFVQSALGFAVLTGIVAYLINVVAGVGERNALALDLWSASGRTGDGVRAVVRILGCEGTPGLHLRLNHWVPAVHRVQMKMHQFPILDLFYRSRDPIYSPEIMLRTLAEISIAAGIAARDPEHRELGPLAEELRHAVDDSMKLIAAQHLGRAVEARLNAPAPDEDDHRALERARKAVENDVPGQEPADGAELSGFLVTAFRTRVILEALDDLTAWRMDERALRGDP